MKKLNRIIYKDKYGLVRTCVCISLLVALCAVFSAYSIVDYVRAAEMQRAGDLARDAVLFFDKTFQKNQGILGDIAELTAVESDENISAYTDILAGDFASIESVSGISPEYRVEYADGEFRLYAPVDNDRYLIGRISPEFIAENIKSSLTADFSFGVYNRGTGEWIINQTCFAEKGYYEALYARNGRGHAGLLLENMTAQVRCPDSAAEGGAYYIAQCPTSVGGCSVALVIPSAYMSVGAGISRHMPLISLMGGAAILLVLIIHTILTTRRIRLSSRNAANAVLAGERMLEITAADGHVALISYHRGSDRIFSCHDGLQLIDEKSAGAPRTLAEFAERCGMSSGDFDHLEEAICDLKSGDQVELIVHCESRGMEERSLRLTAHAGLNDEKSVQICICDCTLQQAAMDRAETERTYQESMRHKTSSIWEINVSRNRWRSIHCHANDVLRRHGIVSRDWKDYSQDLNGPVRRYLHPSDFEAYAQSMNLSEIASQFHSGCTEFVHDYRVRTKGEKSEWHRMRVRIWLDPRSEDLFANLYVCNVDAEKNAELERGERQRILRQSLTALGGIYDGLFYVDLDNDICYTARSTGGDLVTKLRVPYRETFDAYIAASVHPEDRNTMRNVISAYNLRRNMTEGVHFQRQDYRRKIGDNYEDAILIIQPARFENGTIKEIVLAIRSVTPKKTAQTR